MASGSVQPSITYPTSVQTLEFDDDYNTEGFIFVVQDQPLPLSLLAIFPTLVTHDS